MKSVMVFLVALMLSATSVAAADLTQTGFYYPTGTQNLGDYGCVLSSFRNVVAKSNGGWNGTGCGFYQCVEFVKRFYTNEVGDPITQPWGTAAQAYDLGSGSVNKYAQGCTMAPEVGDVLCFAI